MKKITSLLVALFVGFAIQAQEAEIILTQTEGGIGNDGVACADQTAMTTGDNVYLREYNLDDHGITGDIKLTGAEFAVATYIGAPVVVQVQVFEYDGFPYGFDITNLPPALATQGFEVNETMAGEVVRVEFDDTAIAQAGSTLVIGIFESSHNSAYMYIGTADEETKESFLASEACGIIEPQEVGAVGFPGAMHIINIVADDDLGVNDNLVGNIAVYPNPTTDVFNIDLPAGVEVLSSSLVDVMGRTTGVTYSNGQMNVAALAKGVYFLNIDTNQGSFTHKVVKQ